jgi:hypothetical protein
LFFFVFSGYNRGRLGICNKDSKRMNIPCSYISAGRKISGGMILRKMGVIKTLIA